MASFCRKFERVTDPVTGLEMVKCDQCDYWSPSPYCVSNHKSKMHSQEEIELDPNDLNEDQNYFTCHICNTVYNKLVMLKRHLKEKHLTEDGVFKCDICFTVFKSTEREIYFYHLTSEHGIGQVSHSHLVLKNWPLDGI